MFEYFALTFFEENFGFLSKQIPISEATESYFPNLLAVAGVKKMLPTSFRIFNETFPSKGRRNLNSTMFEYFALTFFEENVGLLSNQISISEETESIS